MTDPLASVDSCVYPHRRLLSSTRAGYLYTGHAVANRWAATAQRAAAVSQPAGWYKPTAYATTDRPENTAARIFGKMSLFS